MCFSTLPCFPPFFVICHLFFFLPPRGRGVLVGGGNVRVSGFEAGLAVFICTHRVVLGSFVFRLSSLHLLFSCLFSVLVRTAGCLSPSPSLALVEASCHVVGFFFSSLAIHSALALLSLCFEKDCACRGKLWNWDCLSDLTNWVGPPLAGATLTKSARWATHSSSVQSAAAVQHLNRRSASELPPEHAFSVASSSEEQDWFSPNRSKSFK